MPRQYTPRIPVSCENCGEITMQRPSRAAAGRGKYCSKECYTAAQTGVKSKRWKGVPTPNEDGYLIFTPPDRLDQTLYHRWVMEQHIGRPLLPSEHVHHKDLNKLNCQIDNLVILAPSEHSLLHGELRRGWSRYHDCCVVCGTTKFLHNAKGECRHCYKQRVRSAATVPQR